MISFHAYFYWENHKDLEKTKMNNFTIFVNVRSRLRSLFFGGGKNVHVESVDSRETQKQKSSRRGRKPNAELEAMGGHEKRCGQHCWGNQIKCFQQNQGCPGISVTILPYRSLVHKHHTMLFVTCSSSSVCDAETKEVSEYRPPKRGA